MDVVTYAEVRKTDGWPRQTIDRATLTTVCEYWAPGVTVTGIHEMVANAMVMKGEKKREMNLRLEPLPGVAAEEADEEPAATASPEGGE